MNAILKVQRLKAPMSSSISHRLPAGRRFLSTQSSSALHGARDGRLAPNFPWRDVPSSSTSGSLLQQRTIYARPPNFRPRVLWFIVGAWLPFCVLMADNLRYNPPELAESLPVDHTSIETSPATSPTTPSSSSTSTTKATLDSIESSSLFQNYKREALSSIILSAGFFMTSMALLYPTRIITRLTQVRARPSVPTSGLTTAGIARVGKEAEGHVLVETAANEMWIGKWGRARKIQPERIHVGLIAGGRAHSSYLKLSIIRQPEPTTRLGRLRPSLDSKSYRIDFTPVEPTDYPAKKKEESSTQAKTQTQTEVERAKEREEDMKRDVVVSLRRLEEVFGKIK